MVYAEWNWKGTHGSFKTRMIGSICVFYRRFFGEKRCFQTRFSLCYCQAYCPWDKQESENSVRFYYKLVPKNPKTFMLEIYSTNPTYGFTVPSLKHFIRSDDRTTRLERLHQDKVAQIRHFWKLFQKPLTTVFVLSLELCVDEQLLVMRNGAQVFLEDLGS